MRATSLAGDPYCFPDTPKDDLGTGQDMPILIPCQIWISLKTSVAGIEPDRGQSRVAYALARAARRRVARRLGAVALTVALFSR
jgi:hypothetical protein